MVYRGVTARRVYRPCSLIRRSLGYGFAETLDRSGASTKISPITDPRSSAVEFALAVIRVHSRLINGFPRGYLKSRLSMALIVALRTFSRAYHL